MYISECEEIAESIYNNMSILDKDLEHAIDLAKNNPRGLYLRIEQLLADNSHTIITQVCEAVRETLLTRAKT